MKYYEYIPVIRKLERQIWSGDSKKNIAIVVL